MPQCQFRRFLSEIVASEGENPTKKNASAVLKFMDRRHIGETPSEMRARIARQVEKARQEEQAKKHPQQPPEEQKPQQLLSPATSWGQAVVWPLAKKPNSLSSFESESTRVGTSSHDLQHLDSRSSSPREPSEVQEEVAAPDGSTSGALANPTTVAHLEDEKWSPAVLHALDVEHVLREAQHLPPQCGDVERSHQLRLIGEGCCIPAPEKGGAAVFESLPDVQGGGNAADAFYVDPDSLSFGVADGVGEWETRFGLNARAFAEELMEGAKATAPNVDASSFRRMHTAVSQMMSGAYANATSLGAATIMIAKIDAGYMGVSHLGDCSLILFRRRRSTEAHTQQYEVVARTTEQQHKFNCPFQLSCLPQCSDFPRLLAEGRGELVKAVKEMVNANLDQPTDAVHNCLRVQRGDLIVMGSDGLFDNLYDEDIADLCNRAVCPLEVQGLGGLGDSSSSPLETECASRLAIALAKAAYERAVSEEIIDTPFKDNAKKAGEPYSSNQSGGKPDDITCICAWLA